MTNTKFVMTLLGLGALFSFSFFVFSLKASAVNMSSDNYKVQWGNINIGAGQDLEKSGGGNYLLDLTMGQTGPGLYSKTGYKVRAGFQYIHSIIPFTFTISDLTIDLGNLIPQTPATDTNTLTVSAGGAGGYQVLAYESHPLRSETGVEISNTSCDNGNCTKTNAEIWSQNTTYGFGFNINGDDTPADFVDPTYFRPFADFETYGAGEEIMASSEATKSAQATVTYKANISQTQAAGNYQTQIVYIAVPRY